MTLRPAPTRLVGFIEMEPTSPPSARWEALVDAAPFSPAPLAAGQQEAAKPRDEAPRPPRGRCRTTRILADVTRLCDELQAEYEQARRDMGE